MTLVVRGISQPQPLRKFLAARNGSAVTADVLPLWLLEQFIPVAKDNGELSLFCLEDDDLGEALAAALWMVMPYDFELLALDIRDMPEGLSLKKSVGHTVDSEINDRHFGIHPKFANDSLHLALAFANKGTHLPVQRPRRDLAVKSRNASGLIDITAIHKKGMTTPMKVMTELIANKTLTLS